jgi:hypothetical protein
MVTPMMEHITPTLSFIPWELFMGNKKKVKVLWMLRRWSTSSWSTVNSRLICPSLVVDARYPIRRQVTASASSFSSLASTPAATPTSTPHNNNNSAACPSPSPSPSTDTNNLNNNSNSRDSKNMNAHRNSISNDIGDGHDHGSAHGSHCRSSSSSNSSNSGGCRAGTGGGVGSSKGNEKTGKKSGKRTASAADGADQEVRESLYSLARNRGFIFTVIMTTAPSFNFTYVLLIASLPISPFLSFIIWYDDMNDDNNNDDGDDDGDGGDVWNDKGIGSIWWLRVII